MAKTVAACLKTADRFLESFLVGLTDTHHFTDGAHLGAQLILHAFEFFKSPAGEFDDHIIAIRHIFIQSSVLAAGNIFQCQAGSQHGRYQSDGETGSLGGQSGRTGCTGIDLNNNNTVRNRIMGKLYICTADNLYRFYNAVSLFLQTFLTFLGDRQHRR